MNPNVGQPQQNPFMALLSKLQSQSAPQAPGQNQPMIQALMEKSMHPAGASQPGGTPVSALAQASGAGQASGLPGATQPEVQDAALPGQNPGTTKQLLGAANQLHQVITQLTDPEEIRMIRTILLMLTQLINRDQQVQNQKTGTMSPQQPGQSSFSPGQGGAGSAPGGSPSGAPSGGMPTGLTPGSPSPAA